MGKRGPKPKQIDLDVLKKLCGLQCSFEEMAGFFEIDEKTLNRRVKENTGMKLSEFFKMYRQKGKISLRKSQFSLAHNSASMSKFLGKQYLGQKEDFVMPTADDGKFILGFFGMSAEKKDDK